MLDDANTPHDDTGRADPVRHRVSTGVEHGWIWCVAFFASFGGGPPVMRGTNGLRGAR